MSLQSILVLLVLIILVLFASYFGRRRSVPAMQGEPLPNHDIAPHQNRFKVGLYNIHRGRGVDGQKNLQRIADVLQDVDVVGLCECEGPLIWGRPNQCEQLGNLLDSAALFSPTQKRWGRYDRGNGLLSRLPVSRWYQEPLVDSTGTHPRCVLRADLIIEGGEIPIFVTHLSRRIDQEVQLKTVISKFQQYDRAILVGDFNMERASQPLMEIINQSEYCDAITMTSEDYSNRIDWIITKGVEVVDGGHHPKGASDHHFYWIEVKV